jgi:hypothetical protein
MPARELRTLVHRSRRPPTRPRWRPARRPRRRSPGRPRRRRRPMPVLSGDGKQDDASIVAAAAPRIAARGMWGIIARLTLVWQRRTISRIDASAVGDLQGLLTYPYSPGSVSQGRRNGRRRGRVGSLRPQRLDPRALDQLAGDSYAGSPLAVADASGSRVTRDLVRDLPRTAPVGAG